MAGIFGPERPNWLLHQTQCVGRSKQNSTSSFLPPPTISMYINAVYYPNWHVYKQRPPTSLNLDVISHVFYTFAWVKPDGTVYLSDEWADSQMDVDGTKGCLRSLANLKKQYSFLRVLLSVGGGGKGSENFAQAARTPEGRERFAQTARELVISFGLNGIDIDWEYPADSQQGADYLQLLATLRDHLPAPRYTLTAALPAGPWALRHIDLAAASKFVDLINVMAYDFSGPWVDTVEHHAQLHAPPQPHNETAALSCHSAISYYLSHGVAPQQLLLGIPVYGRSFAHAHRGIGSTYAGHGNRKDDDESSTGTIEYRDLPRPGATERVDAQLGAASCLGPDGTLVTYDTPQTVQMKAAYAKQQRLGGLFYWTGTADAKGARSLVFSGYTALHS